MSENKDKLLEHDYDGIQELDNDLPRWWVGMFVGCIIWSVLYMGYYHIANIGYLSDDEYKLELDASYVRPAQLDAKLLGFLPEYHSPNYSPNGDLTPWQIAQGLNLPAYVELNRDDDTTVYIALVDEESLTEGHTVFVRNCASCHGNLGEGGVGPNLTDDYWLHGNDITSVVKSIGYGYPTKGMISWRGMIKPEQILMVASHVQTLKGTNPPNPKAPQGDLVTE